MTFLQVLIVSGRRIVDGMASKPPPNPPNPAGIKQLEYTLAAVWLLLTHDANRRYLERASIYTPPTKGFPVATRPETREARLTIHSNPNSPRSRTHSSAHTHLMSHGSFGLTDLSQVLEVTPRVESGGAGLEGEGEVVREGHDADKGSETGTSEVNTRGGSSFSNVKVEGMNTDVAAGGANSPNRVNQSRAGRDNFGRSLSLESAQNAREQEELSNNGLEPRKPLEKRARPSTASDVPPSVIPGESAEPSSGSFGSKAPEATDKSLARQRTLHHPGVFTQLLDSPQEKAARKLPGDPLTSGLGAEVKGLEFLVGIIASKGSLKGSAWDACKHLAVNAVLVATQSLVEYEKKVIDLGIGPALAAVAKDPDASEGLRKAAAKFCQVSWTAAVGEQDLSPTCKSYWLKDTWQSKSPVPSWSSRIRS
jgi:hypothetical protein